MHVNEIGTDGVVYDLEIFYGEQKPVWESAQPVEWPEGWIPKPVPGGVGWMTSTNPLRYCQAVTFLVQVTGPVGDMIWIHVTDKEHKNIGYITSTRAPA